MLDKAAEVAETGATPLDFLLATMRDESKPMWLRVSCAKAAAPYVHARLAQLDHAIGMKTAIVIKGGLPDGEQFSLDLGDGP
jgi:hypothetical protein